MKYLAILRDSVSEAIDAKVLYVMLALSGVLIVACLAVSFVPRPAKDVEQDLDVLLNVPMEELAKEFKKELQKGEKPREARQNGLDLFKGLFKTGPTVGYKVVGAEPLQGEPDRPGSEFLFTVRARFVQRGDADKARATPSATEDVIRERFAALGGGKTFLDVVEVRPARSDNPATQEANEDPVKDRDVFFEVQTRPNHFTRTLWPADPYFLMWPMRFVQTPQGQGLPLGVQAYVIIELLANSLGATVILLVSIVLTSLFIPNMLRKGTIDLLLVKPIYRWGLLLYKYVGGLTFIVLNITFLIGGLWLVFGARSGLWINSMLLVIPVLVLVFATLYAVSTLFAVWTRSAIVAILMSCLVWGGLLSVDYTYRFIDGMHKQEVLLNTPADKRNFEGWWVDALGAVHRALPRYRDMVAFTSQTLQDELLPQQGAVRKELGEEPINWQQSLLVSGGYLAGLLGIACVIFSRRDY